MIKTDIQIRFADVDMLGHVNNVNLQHYFDLGKFNFYRSVLGGETLMPLRRSLIIASTSTNYYSQILPTDKICVTTAVKSIGTKSVTLFQQIIDQATGRIDADCQTVVVGYDFLSQQAIEIPAEWKGAMAEHVTNVD